MSNYFNIWPLIETATWRKLHVDKLLRLKPRNQGCRNYRTYDIVVLNVFLLLFMYLFAFYWKQLKNLFNYSNQSRNCNIFETYHTVTFKVQKLFTPAEVIHKLLIFARKIKDIAHDWCIKVFNVQLGSFI